MGHRKKDNSADTDVTNVHHIIGRMHHSWANVEEDTNKMLISVLRHRALNTLVNDKQSPQEQLGVMYKIRKPVLSNTVKEIIETLLDMERVDFYDSKFIKR